MIFFLVQKIKRYKKPVRLPCLVISVGNLRVGGTGKSVVTQLLTDIFSDTRVAIISRGYGRRSAAALLLSDGNTLLAGVEDAGDEAFMLASMTSAIVAVGSNRVAAWLCVKNNDDVVFKQTKIVILDDGYQNKKLVKDVEIVLVDALQPFGNNHCLPAGPLREKDFSRASMVLLTRSDSANKAAQKRTKRLLKAAGYAGEAYCTRHALRGVFLRNEGRDVRKQLRGMRCLAMAGIGNFASFVSQVAALGCLVVAQLEYPDHYVYTFADVKALKAQLRRDRIEAIVVTAKDWYKLAVLQGLQGLPVFVVQVGIEFLSPREYHNFVGMLRRRCGVFSSIS